MDYIAREGVDCVCQDRGINFKLRVLAYPSEVEDRQAPLGVVEILVP